MSTSEHFYSHSASTAEQHSSHVPLATSSASIPATARTTSRQNGASYYPARVPSILSPETIHVSTEIHSLRRATTPKWLQKTSLVILAILGVLILFLIFVPWQQNITGSGRVTSFVPGVRPQTIDAQITGRIVRWFVNEGKVVKAGDTIAILQDLNVNFMDNEFLEKIERVRERTVQAQEMAVQAARQRTIQAEQRELAAKAALENAKIEIQTARIRLKRAEDLTKEGLAAQRELETAILNFQKAQADSIRSETALESARRDVQAAKNEESRIIQQADAIIAEAELRLENARRRGGASIITAPIDGFIVRIAAVGAGQTVKEGEMLAMIVPTAGARDQAVEAFISSRDAAIVDIGRPVRIQFSGFPAFVFNPGWDNFTINTFGGKVAVVDAVDDGSGYYRVLIVPDSTQKQGTWPSSQYLRQGTPCTAWILLDEVPVGFEIWRQLNGFPPVLPHKPAASSGKANTSSDSKKK
ncbi:MAG: biotin/lipoyl-binding protein [Bacteroidota bacterium]|nr:HlyD family secretion protein [Candidatus Kapabacteria bacterium]MDW8219796.1 biotin/lipoyl-binding protein [Bacteroidota bacterium]